MRVGVGLRVGSGIGLRVEWTRRCEDMEAGGVNGRKHTVRRHEGVRCEYKKAQGVKTWRDEV
jgi:hypothetical protein